MGKAVWLATTAAAAILTVGCRQSEAEILGELRHQFVQSCVSQMAETAAKTPGFDTSAFCTCLTDKALADRSASEVSALFDDNEKMRAAARQASAECRPSDMPDLPPIEIDAPTRAQAGQNKQKAAERPRRTDNAARPKTAPATTPGSAGPVATPRPMPTPDGPPGGTRPATPPGFGPSPTPPRPNTQAPRPTPPATPRPPAPTPRPD